MKRDLSVLTLPINYSWREASSAFASRLINLATELGVYACTQVLTFSLPQPYRWCFGVSFLWFSFWFFSEVSLNFNFLNFWPHGIKITFIIRIFQTDPWLVSLKGMLCSSPGNYIFFVCRSME